MPGYKTETKTKPSRFETGLSWEHHGMDSGSSVCASLPDSITPGIVKFGSKPSDTPPFTLPDIQTKAACTPTRTQPSSIHTKLKITVSSHKVAWFHPQTAELLRTAKVRDLKAIIEPVLLSGWNSRKSKGPAPEVRFFGPCGMEMDLQRHFSFYADVTKVIQCAQ